MIGTDASVRELYLRPGEFFFGGGRTRVRTLLGSCVSITLWHPLKRIGGMCHFMLPQRHRQTHGAAGRFGDEVMDLFLAEIRAAGTCLVDYQAKLFGGGRMYPRASGGLGDGVAAQNVTRARGLVQQYGLNVIGEDLGGAGHRQVLFELWSGDVWVRRVRPMNEGGIS